MQRIKIWRSPEGTVSPSAHSKSWYKLRMPCLNGNCYLANPSTRGRLVKNIIRKALQVQAPEVWTLEPFLNLFTSWNAIISWCLQCFSFFLFYFIFKLYNIVLVLPNIEMNPPQVYMCSPSWALLPPPSPYPPSGSSQCTSPKHPVSCIEPGLATRFIHDIIHVSMPFSQISPPYPSPTESIRLIYTSVSLLLSRTQGYRYHLSKFHIYALVYCIGVFPSGLLHSV